MKIVTTPYKNFIMPESFENEIKQMSDKELIQKIIADEKETGFIEPFKLQFILDKGLYSKYLKIRKKTLKADCSKCLLESCCPCFECYNQEECDGDCNECPISGKLFISKV